jgi:hypothetical protein
MKSNLMMGLAISISISVVMMGAGITERVNAQSKGPVVEFPPLEHLDRPSSPARPKSFAPSEGGFSVTCCSAGPVTTGYQKFDPEFDNGGGVMAKSASFSSIPFFVGRCRMQSPGNHYPSGWPRPLDRRSADDVNESADLWHCSSFLRPKRP